MKRYYKTIVVGAYISTSWIFFAHPLAQPERKAANNQGVQEIILAVLIEPQTNEALWLPPYNPHLIFKLLWLVYLFTDLKELRFLEFLVDLMTFLEEQQVCDPRTSLFVFLFPHRKYVLYRSLLSIFHSGLLLSKACCLKLDNFLQHYMRQVSVVYLNLPFGNLHTSTCIALWDLLHQVILYPFQYMHIYLCQLVAFE